MVSGSLVVVGVGMTFVGHVTVEVRAHIEQADRVFVVVANPAMVSWLEELNPNTSILYLYQEREAGRDAAREWESQIADAIEVLLTPVREGDAVCLVLDGHPGVAVPPVHEAVRRARAEGLVARKLPAVSAEDCMFADLGIDPARHGCQSFEATDFLIRRRVASTTSALVLRQIGLIGEFMLMGRRNERGLRVLTEVLQESYGEAHEVVVYEAAPYAIAGPTIQRIPLNRLSHAAITDFSTLYVPPTAQAPLDEAMIRRLGITEERVRS